MPAKKGELAKIILKGLLLAGGIAIASTNPYFLPRILPKLLKYASYKLKLSKKKKQQFFNSFYYLKKKGLVNIEYKGKQIYISLTDKGKKVVGKYQIDDLKIKKPWRWDKKWRILIFDIKDKQRIKREALRGKIKELGMFQLQKSVWVHPYDFFNEMDLLRRFFGLKDDEMKLIVASKIENDQEARAFFGLK